MNQTNKLPVIFSKSLNIVHNIASMDDNIFFNHLFDNNESVEKIRENYNNFSIADAPDNSSIEAILDEIASEVLIYDKFINENIASQNEKITTSKDDTQHCFHSKMYANQSDHHLDPKEFVNRESMSKLYKKQIGQQADDNNLYISKLPTKLQQQIKFLEDQLASSEPFAILDDSDISSSTDTLSSNNCSPKLKFNETARRKIKKFKKLKTVKKIRNNIDKNNSLDNSEDRFDRKMDENIQLLNEELLYIYQNI